METYKLYGIIIVLLVLIYYLYNNKESQKVYWFYKPGCPYCDEMESEWENVEKKLQGSCITLRRINTADPKHGTVKKNFDIDTVPQIIKIKSNGMRYKYEGERKTDDIISWIHEDFDNL